MNKKPTSRRKKTVFILITAVFIIYITVGYIITSIMYSRYFIRRDQRAYFSTNLTYDDIKSEFPRREISFTSETINLTGAIYGDAGGAGIIVIAAGSGGGIDSYIPTIQYFARHNWLVLVYNGTGINDSGGKNRVNLYQAVTDLRNTLRFIQNDAELSNLPVMLFGHSQGAFAVCAVLNYTEATDVKAVVSFAGMNNAGDMVDVYGRQTAGVFYPLLKPFTYIVDYTDFSIGKEYNAIRGINNTQVPVILVQGAEDTVVPLNVATTHFEEAITNPNVEIIFLTDEWNNGHNSMFWSKEAFEYRADVNATWLPYQQAHNISVWTDDDMRAWAQEIQLDRIKINSIDENLFDRINTFYVSAMY